MRAPVVLLTSPWWGTGNLLPPFSAWEEGQQQPEGAAHLLWALSRHARNRAIHALHGNMPSRWQKAKGTEKPTPSSSSPKDPTQQPWALRPEDWPVPVLAPAELQASSPGVALVPLAEAPALLQRLQGSPASVAVVTLRSLPSSSPSAAEHFSVPLQRGKELLPAKVWVHSCGPAPVAPTLAPKKVGSYSPDPSTTQLVVEVDERWFSSPWNEFQLRGARGLRRLLAGRVSQPADLLDVFALAYRGEVQGSRALRAVVRVVPAAQAKLLASSGEDGIFFRSLFRPETAEQERAKHGVVWLDLPLAEALEQARGIPGACGLVRNARGLGVRVAAAQLEAAYAALKGKDKPPPKALYEVSGVPLAMGPGHMEKVLVEMGWSGRALRTFVRRGARVWVVEADSPPSATVWTVDSALVTVQPAQPRRATPAPWSRTPPKEIKVQMGPPARGPSPVVLQPTAPTSGVALTFAAAVAKGLRGAPPPQKGKLPQAPAAAPEIELETPLPTGGTNTPRRSNSPRQAPTPTPQPPTGLPGLGVMETLLRQLVDEALAAERQKLHEERAQLQREKKALARERKALRPSAAPSAPQASPPVPTPANPGAPAAPAAPVPSAALAPSVAILPPAWAAERAELLLRIAALEETVAALSPTSGNKRPHPSSASSTPCKPGTKKKAGAADDMDGVDETAPAPLLSTPAPSQQGSPDKRTPMENDD